MKSAWELALERSGGALSELSDDKKQRIAEIDSIYKAKLVGAEMAARERGGRPGLSHEDLRCIQDDLEVERASIRSKMEQEKDKVRKS